MASQEEEVAHLRHAIREAHEVLKDLRGATVAAKHEIHELGKTTVRERIEQAVEAGLDEYKGTLSRAIEQASKKVFDRFDFIADILMGEDKQSIRTGKASIPEMVERLVQKREEGKK